jgi:hypothetical protein
MSRFAKALHQNKAFGVDVPGHREHKSKRGRKKSYWSTKIAVTNRQIKLKKFIRSEARTDSYDRA